MAEAGDPQVVPEDLIITLPLPDTLHCPQCRGVRTRQRGGTGSFSAFAGLSKHLKFSHPGQYNIIIKCSVCGYVGETKYPMKDTRKHMLEKHPNITVPPSSAARARPRAESDSVDNRGSVQNNNNLTVDAGARGRVVSDNSIPTRGRVTSGGSSRRQVPSTSSSSSSDTTPGPIRAAPPSRRLTRVSNISTRATRGTPSTAAATTTTTIASTTTISGVRRSSARSSITTAARASSSGLPISSRRPSTTVSTARTYAAVVTTSATLHTRRSSEAAPITSGRLLTRPRLARAAATGSTITTTSITTTTSQATSNIITTTTPTITTRATTSHVAQTVSSAATLTTTTVTVSTCGGPIMAPARRTGLACLLSQNTLDAPVEINWADDQASLITTTTTTNPPATPPEIIADGVEREAGSERESSGDFVMVQRKRRGGRMISSSSSSTTSSGSGRSSRITGAQSGTDSVFYSPNNSVNRSSGALQRPIPLVPPSVATSRSENNNNNNNNNNLRTRINNNNNNNNEVSAARSARRNHVVGGMPASSAVLHRQPSVNILNRRVNTPGTRETQVPQRSGAPTINNNNNNNNSNNNNNGRNSNSALDEKQRLITLAARANTTGDLEQLAAKLTDYLKASAGKPMNQRMGGQQRRQPQANNGHRRQTRAVAVNNNNNNARGIAGAGINVDEVNASLGNGEHPQLNPTGGGPAFHRGGRQVEQAARIQQLYRSNRKRAMQEILAGPSAHCKVPKQEVDQYFRTMYSLARDDPVNGVIEWPEWPEHEDDEQLNRALIRPFEISEVKKRLKKAHNSAPGPDRLTYGDLRRADQSGALLTAVFNVCLRLSAFPSAWKNSNTVLIYKKGAVEDLSGWRPLAMGDTVAKLFAALLADRLTEFSMRGKRLGEEQKGFLHYEGCAEHNYVLQEIIEDSKRTGKDLLVAWLDLTNAFGSIPHTSIYRALEGAAIPVQIQDLIKSMYTNCTTQVRTCEGFTEPIRIAAGVKQGCPASPITFNLTLESLIRATVNQGGGYEIGAKRWTTLAYADDLALVASSVEDMQRILNTASVEARKIGLQFNPSKCATLHLNGKASKQRALETVFKIQGNPLKPLRAGDAYHHLGIPTGFQVRQTPIASIDELIRDVRTTGDSLLTPWQKFDAVATFILPRLDFVLRGAHVEKFYLTVADKVIRKLGKSWMNLPQRASAEPVYIPPWRGGGGLIPLADLADVLTIAHAFRILNCKDPTVSTLARQTLGRTVERRIKRVASQEEIAEYLSGSTQGIFFGPSSDTASFWSRVRTAVGRLKEKLKLKWRYDDGTDELLIECRSSNDNIAVIPPAAKSQVTRRLRTAVQEYYLSTLLAKPDQGKVYELSSGVPVANHFMRNGSYTRFAEWRFIHRARLDVLPLNGARRWGEGDKRCRKCNYALESLPHVLCHCTPHSGARQLRHNAIVDRIAKATRLPGNIFINQRVEGITDANLASLRPDIVIRDEVNKNICIVDVTVPFENRKEGFDAARMEKINKYAPLAEALYSQGYNVSLDALIVGALGTWDPKNEVVLRQLAVSPVYASMMRRLIVSDTIHWSRDIYVEHVSGVRQYSIPPADP